MSLEQVLKKTPFFNLFNQSQLESLVSIGKTTSFESDMTVFKEGDQGDTLYVILSGKVSVWRGDQENELQLSILSPDDFFGEMALFDNKPRSATVSTVGYCEFFTIGREKLLELLFKSPQLITKLFTGMSRKIRDVNEKFFQEILFKNQELEKAMADLKQLDKMKMDFINLTSHEFKTPVTNMVLASQALESLVQESNQQIARKFANNITRNALRLNKIMEEILKLTLGQKGDLLLKKERVKPHVLLESIKNEIAPFIAKRGQQLTVNAGRDLPDVDADPEKIFQAINNLAMNAIKFTPDGGRIGLYARQDLGGIRFGVMDTGIGIPPEEKERIFDVFYEVKDINLHSSGSYEFGSSGLGIGLTIASKFIQLHGGRLQVDSKVEEGSDFYFTLSCT